jgi:hypothetical protein
VKWKAGVDMSIDIYTNNLPRPDFERHDREYVGED